MKVTDIGMANPETIPAGQEEEYAALTCMTFEDCFDFIQSNADFAPVLNVTYDPVLGYPTSVYVIEFPDDPFFEYGYVNTNFTPMP